MYIFIFMLAVMFGGCAKADSIELTVSWQGSIPFPRSQGMDSVNITKKVQLSEQLQHKAWLITDRVLSQTKSKQYNSPIVVLTVQI